MASISDSGNSIKFANTQDLIIDISFPQIVPMVDTNDGDLLVQHSFILDPYVLLIRNDATCVILKTNANGELDEMPLGSLIRENPWRSGCLYATKDKSPSTLLCLLSVGGTLLVSIADRKVCNFNH